eukprot:CAMPEP_0181225666 /NCGR_PEP_ID=MMETSP1096-20121128/31826_1 /TAXON_ID=156174 ORGANISM="Chrysochromulina ericina, Strain CCMP281" /NCGR_SAMPLE_ID=MMETSP1096 /ASSEMBLY_ACC=CAM_ASM_000453 /LENGTH=98 /DNA_ID=CAMNT_0023318919 /DNA_START=431 /DNA_END=723 /DNA_ORIENTATION=-
MSCTSICPLCCNHEAAATSRIRIANRRQSQEWGTLWGLRAFGDGRRLHQPPCGEPQQQQEQQAATSTEYIALTLLVGRRDGTLDSVRLLCNHEPPALL